MRKIYSALTQIFAGIYCKVGSSFVRTILFAGLLFLSSDAISQSACGTVSFGGDINSFSLVNMTYRSGLGNWISPSILAGSTNATANFLFGVNGSYSNKWGPGAGATINSQQTCYANGGNGTYSQTSGKYYTFIMGDASCGSNNYDYVFETSATPVSVTGITQSPSIVNISQPVTITATTSANLPTGQGVFLRWSTVSNFATSTTVNMTGSTNTYSTTIAGTNNTSGATIYYYVFTSGGTAVPGYPDGATINTFNNSGANFSYTVSSSYISVTAGGNWATPATWVGGVVPGSGANILIAAPGNVVLTQNSTVGNLYVQSGATLTINNNTNTLTATAVNDTGTVSVTATLAAANKITITTMNVANGGVFTNSAGLATALAIANFNVNNGGTYTHSAVGSVANGATNDFPGSTSRTLGASSNVTINTWANGGSTPAALPATNWGNLTINITSLGGTWNQNGALNTINGNLVPTATGGVVLCLAQNSAQTVTIAGNIWLNGAGQMALVGGTAACVANVGGSVRITSTGILTTSFSSGAGTLNITGNLNLSGSGAIYGCYSTGEGTINVTGIDSVSAGTLTLSYNTGPCKLSVTGNTVFNGGTITGQVYNTNSAIDTFTFAGNVTVAGATVELSTGAASTSSTLMTITGSSSIFSMTSGSFYMLYSYGPATLNMTGASSSFNLSGGTFYMNDANSGTSPTIPTITLAGAFALTSGATFNWNSIGGTYPCGTINVAGNFTASGTSKFTYTTSPTYPGVINFNGSSQSLTSTTTGTFRKTCFRVLSGSTCTLTTANFTLATSTADSFTVNNGGTLNCGTYNITDNGTGVSTFINNGTLIMGDPNGIVTAPATTGNIQTGAAVFNSTSSCNYTYQGTGAQSTGTGLPGSIAGTLTINNSATIPLGVTLTNSTAVSGTFYLQNGILILGAKNLTNTGTLSGGSYLSYVYTSSTGSYITPTSTSVSTTLPLGCSDRGVANYTPLTIGTTPSVVTLTSSVLGGTTNIPGSPVGTCIVDLAWNVIASSATTANVTFNWLSGNDSTSFSASTNCDLGIYSSSYAASSLAAAPSGSGTTGSPYSITASAVSIPTATNKWVMGNHGCIVTPPTPPTVTGFTVATGSPSYGINTSGANWTGYVGSVITLTGTNLVNPTTVKVNGVTVATTITYSGGTSISFAAPDLGGGSGTISVTTAGGGPVSSTGTYTDLGYISTAATAWNVGTTWLGGNVPPVNAIVTINTAVICSTAVATSVGNYTSITINSGNSVTLNNAASTLSATTVTNNGTLAWSAAGTLTIAAGGSLTNAASSTYTAGTGILSVGAGGTLTNTSAMVYTTNSGTVTFAGAGTIAGTQSVSIYNLNIAGGLTLTTPPTVTNNFTINTNGYVASGTPIYGGASMLIYNTGSGATFNQGNEWSAGSTTTAGSGVPFNVTIQNSTPVAMLAANHAMAGSLNITSGGLTLNAGSGDLYVGANWSRSASTSFAPSGRAVFFNGTTTQLLTVSGGEIFNYLIVQNTGTLKLASAVTVNSYNGLTLSSGNATSTIDLNGNTFTLSGGGNLSLNSGNRFVTSTATGGVFAISGVTAISSAGTVVFGNNVTVALSSGMDFGSGVSTIGGGTTGVLQIQGGGYVAGCHPPVYATGSTLQYYSGSYSPGYYSRGCEWQASSGAGYPYHVQLSNNTIVSPGGSSNTGTVLNLAGNLTIDAGSSLYMDYGGTSTSMTVPLIVGGSLLINGNLSEGNASVSGGDIQLQGNWTLAGTFTSNAHTVTFNSSTAAQTITGATTFGGLTISNSYSTATVTPAASIGVNNALTLSGGKLVLGTNTLTIGSSGTTSPGSAGSYVQTNSSGQMKATVGSSNVIFPVGNATYNPITLNNAGGTSDVYGVVEVDGTYASANDATTIVNRRWQVTEAVSGGSNLTATCQYNGSDPTGANFATGTSPLIGFYNGASWTQNTASVAGSDPYTYSGGAFTPSNLTTGTQYFGIGKDNCFIPGAPTVTGFTVATGSPSYGVNTSGANWTGYVGSVITLTGTNLINPTTVKVNGVTVATTITYTSTSSISFAAPDLGGGTGTISVTTANGGPISSTGTYTDLGYISTAATAWNVGTTWLGGNVPPVNAIVTINTLVSCSTAVATSVVNYTSITINSGKSLTLNNAASTLSATTVTNNGTLAWSAAGTLTIAAGGSLTNAAGSTYTAGTGILSVGAGGTLTNTSAMVYTTNSGTVTFAGAGTIAGTQSVSIYNLNIAGGLTLTTPPTVTNNFTINTNGYVASGTPIYGGASMLIYNTGSGATFNQGNEWSAGSTTTAGSGVPFNVTIQNSTPVAMLAANHAMAGSLNITSGGLTLNSGSGDLYVGANWSRSGSTSFAPSGRAVFFNGTTTQLLTVSGGEIFNYLIVQNTGTLKLASAVTVNSYNGLTLSSGNATSTIDLNGNTFTLSGGGNLSLNSGNRFVTSTATGGVFAISGVTAISSAGTVVFGNNVTVALSSGMDFGSGVSTIGGGTTGVLQIQGGGYVVSCHPPVYATGSTLQYYSGSYSPGYYSRGCEWQASSGAGYPYHV